MQPNVRTVLAVDPGSVKCGLALVSGPPIQIVSRDVVPKEQLVVEVGAKLRANASVSTLIIGSGTQGRVLFRALQEAFPDIEMVVVDEHGSSQRARLRYCLETPAKGWRKLLPRGMRTPEQSYDDWVAVLLAEEYLQRPNIGESPQ